MRRKLFSKSFIRIFLAWLLTHTLFMCCRRCWMEVRTKLQAQLYSCFFVHLVIFFCAASKQQLSSCISSLRGHVASLLRHMVGSVGMQSSSDVSKIYDMFTEDAFWKLTFIFVFFFSFQVVDHAYHLGNAAQKQELLGELYSTELQLFKDLNSTSEKR